MTKEAILEKLKFDLELRNRSADTIHDYAMHVRMYQDHFDKPADQMGVEEIKGFLHYQLTEKSNSYFISHGDFTKKLLYGLIYYRMRIVDSPWREKIKNVADGTHSRSENYLRFGGYLLKTYRLIHLSAIF